MSRDNTLSSDTAEQEDAWLIVAASRIASVWVPDGFDGIIQGIGQCPSLQGHGVRGSRNGYGVNDPAVNRDTVRCSVTLKGDCPTEVIVDTDRAVTPGIICC